MGILLMTFHDLKSHIFKSFNVVIQTATSRWTWLEHVDEIYLEIMKTIPYIAFSQSAAPSKYSTIIESNTVFLLIFMYVSHFIYISKYLMTGNTI